MMELIWQQLENTDPHTAGRQLLSRLYTQATGQPLPPIAITPQGKPYFPSGDWHFSISHTKCHVFCCLSRKNVGIDAEESTRRPDLRLARRYLSEAEQARLAAAPDPAEALLRLWVLKEAYAKLTGRGLGNYLKTTDFHPDDPRISVIDGCLVALLEGE